jgi:hypothetical protein
MQYGAGGLNMHMATLLGAVGILLASIGPWEKLGNGGVISGIYYWQGLFFIAVAVVIVASAGYNVTMQKLGNPIIKELKLIYLIAGVGLTIFSIFVFLGLKAEAVVIARQLHLSPDYFMGWGIGMLPWASGIVALGGIGSYIIPGDASEMPGDAKENFMG